MEDYVPKELRLGWKIVEQISTNNIYDYSRRHEDTDEADKYLDRCGKQYEPSSDDHCWARIEVLQELKGKPWNNLALAAVHMLRPSFVRVTKDWMTLDHRVWRVTVRLDEDGRTIRDIVQEVEIAGVGIKTGQDFVDKLQGKQIPSPSDVPHVYDSTS